MRLRGFVQFEQRQVMPAGDVDQHAFGAAQADFVQQRVGNGLLGGLNGAIFATRLAGAHHRLAHFVHYGANIGKIEVDQAGTHHQVGHALNTLIQNVIRQAECFGEGGFFIGQTEQVLVGNDDQRINNLLQCFDAIFGLRMRLAPSNWNGLVTTPTVRTPKFARGLCNDRRGPGSGAPAHAAVMKHMCAPAR